MKFLANGENQYMTPEAKVKRKVYKILKENKAYYFSPIMTGYGKMGVPDVIVCHKGVFIGIECKVGNKKPTELQQKNLDDIALSGGYALVINDNNIDKLRSLLKKI
tara:strand:+ start:696 stop:1013 length:318 start_codon:yes stop_codon:yes gene_type:complete